MKNVVLKKLVPLIPLVRPYAIANAIIFIVITDTIVNFVVNPNAFIKSALENALI